MASQRHVLVAATAVTAVLAGVLVAGSDNLPRSAATPRATMSAPPTAPGPSVASPTPTGSSASAGHSPSTAPRSETGPKASGSPTEREADLEMPPATSTTGTDTALPGMGLQDDRQQAAREELRRDFPASRFREGALADGHPRHNVPVPRGAEVWSSSLTTVDGRIHVDVVARVAGAEDQVLRFYRIQLGRVGFTERPTPGSLPGAVTFRRGPDSVALAVRPAAADTEVSLRATLRTGE